MIQLGQTMFKENEAFCNKWKAILNKCIYNLMLLIIDQSLSVSKDTTAEIETLMEKLEGGTDSETFDKRYKELKEEGEMLEKKMQDLNIWKFVRKRKDYKSSSYLYI